MVETGIGRGLLVAFASHPAVGLPSDLAASNRYFDDDLVVPPWALVGGTWCPGRPSPSTWPTSRRFATAHAVIT